MRLKVDRRSTRSFGDVDPKIYNVIAELLTCAAINLFTLCAPAYEEEQWQNDSHQPSLRTDPVRATDMARWDQSVPSAQRHENSRSIRLTVFARAISSEDFCPLHFSA